MDDVEVEVELGSVQVEGSHCWCAGWVGLAAAAWAPAREDLDGQRLAAEVGLANVGQASAAHGCLESLSVSQSFSVTSVWPLAWVLYLSTLSATHHLQLTAGGSQSSFSSSFVPTSDP